MSFEITERWLMDAGGWQAMKPARAAWQSGAVLVVEFDGARLRGQVRGSGKTWAAGLLIKSRTDVTNLCSCPHARRDGALCEHSLALGLAWIHRGKTTPAAPAHTAASTAGAPASPRSSAAATPPKKPVDPRTSGPLAVALPANFFEGMKRQRLALSLRTDRSRPAETDADRALHEWLAAQSLANVPPQLALADRGQIESLMVALVSHPSVTVAGKPLNIISQGVRLPLQIASTASPSVPPPARRQTSSPSPSAVASPTPSAPEISLQIDPQALRGAGWWTGASQGALYFKDLSNLFLIKELPLLRPFFTESGEPQAVTLALSWLARHGSELAEIFDIDESMPAWPRVRLARAMPRFRLAIDGTLRSLTARLFCRYEGVAEFTLPSGVVQPDPFPLFDPREPGVFRERDRGAEVRAAAELEHAGFSYDRSDNQFILKSEAAVFQFFAAALPSLEDRWAIEYSSRAREAFRGLERITPRFNEVAQGTDWLAFDVALVGSGGSTITQAEARRWLQTGQGTKRLPNGKLAVLAKENFADLEEVLRDLSPDQEHGHFRVDKSQLGYLEASVARFGPAPPETKQSLVDKNLLTNEWQKILRDYQSTGARWMLALAASHWGGILADEMGLGKTVQTLAVIATLRAQAQQSSAPAQPCLVVAPTSLLGNWQEEAARFAPDLKVLVVRSGERTQELAALASVDLVITSYQLLVRDLPSHAAVTYHAAFLDEAGFIRNPDTQIAKAVRRLRTGARFALTGTPIENSIRDLWAIMDFVLPGYLGPRNDFRDRYEGAIQTGQPAALDRLRRRMAPYWLRRLKQDVAKELPSKIEKIIRCEMTRTQRDMYAAIQREGVAKVDEARRARSAGQARITMLTALLRLRQTCGDPRLLGESFPDRDPSEFSTKWAALTELLEEIRDGGHSVLIFSQFATQLKLLEDAVRHVGLDFCRLDGASRDREAQVNAFKEDPAKRVFLISLKAGGFGLNLTKADTVIHFDPWWNPAVEAQATDRAHRIGQARPVTVYKLIAAGTVEEKIIDLQKRKRQLMETALADDNAPLMDALDDATLDSLLSST